MNLKEVKFNLDNNIGNYYENIVEYIRLLIEDQRKDEAFEILKEEISQPYVPSETLKELEMIFDEVYVSDLAKKQISVEDVKEAFLNLKIENIVHEFHTINLRLLSNEIIYYIANSKDYISMSVLIYNLIDQQCSINLSISKFGYTKEINPITLDIVDEELLKKYEKLFENKFEKEPVYIKYCMDMLQYFLLVSFPFNLDKDFDLFDCIVTYVLNIVNQNSQENVSKEFINIIEYDKEEKNE